jgi:hypothetical protein
LQSSTQSKKGQHGQNDDDQADDVDDIAHVLILSENIRMPHIGIRMLMSSSKR